MSNSRLEKFIYAICSMDVSDLPVPLSRIEKLWNCLITGETPDFEPLSRNEKYLMAMLDRYDISNLPAPMSRGEKLLYKIAVGETDLSDVPGYLSRYEELLKYLIENGGISGGDFEYVLYTINQSLYTLYTTAEKPVKSAILKGQTLVNIFQFTSKDDFVSSNALIIEGTTMKFNADGTYQNFWLKNNGLVKTNTDYLFIVDILENTLVYKDSAKDTDNALYLTSATTGNNDGNFFQHGAVMLISDLKSSKRFIKKMTSNPTSTGNESLLARGFLSPNAVSGTLKMKLMIIEYQEGMENWDIPYFTGMQSVKMPVLCTTGKNLFQVTFEQGSIYGVEGKPVHSTTRARNIDFIKLTKGNTYTFSVDSSQENSNIMFREFLTYSTNDYNSFKVGNLGTYKKQFTYTPTEDEYIKFVLINNTTPEGVVDINEVKIQIEYGMQATPYESYKTNILSTPEDLELRGIGNVKDELNVATGELTQRISEVVLDGSEGWSYNPNWSNGDYLASYTKFFTSKANGSYNILSNNIQTGRFITNGAPTSEFICGENGSHVVYVCLRKDRLLSSPSDNINDYRQAFLEYLQKNPITVQYQLATESIKTVDLTTVDQDGQPTKLKTFNDITYVEINAESIIPSVDVEVATKINETLSTMGLQHNDISETQNKLGQTIDEQTENTDATMMATTEIYEQTL